MLLTGTIHLSPQALNLRLQVVYIVRLRTLEYRCHVSILAPPDSPCLSDNSPVGAVARGLRNMHVQTKVRTRGARGGRGFFSWSRYANFNGWFTVIRYAVESCRTRIKDAAQQADLYIGGFCGFVAIATANFSIEVKAGAQIERVTCRCTHSFLCLCREVGT